MRIGPYLALARRAAEANLRRPDHPFKLTFAITFWCNYKCKTCNIWLRKPKDELSAEEIDRFFAKSNRFSWVDVTGGEVSLRKDFPQICESLIRHNRDLLLLHFPTNGYLTDRILEQTQEILGLKPPKLIITVSMDGDQEMNDFVRGVPGGYERQMETFRRLRALKGVEVVLGMTLSKFNAHHREAAFAAAQREVPGLEYRDLHVNIVHESAHYLGNTEEGLRDYGAGTKERLMHETRVHARLRARVPIHPVDYLERAYLSRVEDYLRTGVTPMRCHALRSSCFIDSWGTVFPCTIYDKPLGSLRDTDYDLAPIWQAAQTRQVQGEIWEKQCPQCWTPCEAYPSIMGNFLRPDWRGPAEPERPRREPSSGGAHGGQADQSHAHADVPGHVTSASPEPVPAEAASGASAGEPLAVYSISGLSHTTASPDRPA